MGKYTLLIWVLFLTACQSGGNQEQADKEKDKEEEEKIVVNVEAAKSYVGMASAVFRSTAVIEADRAATVTSKTSGIILDILVEEGDYVEKDQVLLVLESDEQQLSLASAEANYSKSLNNYQRAKKLISKGLTNQEQIDNLRFETDALKTSVEQAKMNLSFTKIKAPFSGVVVKRHVKIGNLIQNATDVFDVVDFDSLQAKIDVPEHQWPIMKAGLDVKFEFDAINDPDIHGTVERVSPMIDSSSGTFEVTIAVDNSSNQLRPGLFAKAEIIYDQRNDVVLVDKDAIIREDELSFVYVLNGENEVSKTEVKLGYEMDDSFEIISGIAIDETVITTGKNNLTPETDVNVINYDDAS